MGTKYLVNRVTLAIIPFTKNLTTIFQKNTFWQSTPIPHQPRLHIALISCIALLIASACGLASPQNIPATPMVKTTSWGLLKGDFINVNKQVTCGVGCPEPLHLKIQTIQIDKVNGIMIWNAHFFAPVHTSTSGLVNASFPTFDLQSNTTALNTATQTINVPASNVQARFPFIPVSNETYTLNITANYQTITNGIIAIEPKALSYEPVTMSFQP